MGAPGLLGVVDNNAPVFSLNSDAAKSLDIVYDIQGLLHRGKLKCEVEQIATLQQAGEQVPMQLWSPLVEYVFSTASHIASCVRSATFVIDGAQLPSKNDEVVKRKRAKAKLFVEAVKLNVTDMAGARKKFSSSIEVSIDSVRNAIIQRLSSANLTIIQAPNEGDAQLAWLLKSNCVDVVFCNDSDLLLYGCERVIVVKSTNNPYTGSEYEISDAFNKTGHLLYNYTHDMLIALALVCGCDFSNGISGISWKKGANLIRDHWNEDTPLDLDALIKAAKAMGKVVQSNFIEQFTRGFLTFKHQRVFNSSTNTIQYLSPPTDNISPSSLAETLGEPIADTSISQDIANGILHPLKLKPYDEVLPVEKVEEEEVLEGAVESSESRARIIHKEMKEFEQEFNDLSDEERKALLDEYNQKLLLKEQEMQHKEAIDPSDPDVNLWKKREAAFNKYEHEYQHNIKQHGTGNVDEEQVIQWTMFVIKKVEDKHGKGVSGYGLKAMPGKDGTPLRNEDLMYIVDNNRTPTACKITHIVQAGDSSVAIGRHYKRSECRRYDEESMEDVTGSNQLIHRYIQFPESIRGDCGGYYGELVLTKVLFVVMANVLNRTYFGTAIDLSGLKDHCFGLSFIINFSELLDNNAMGICTAQSSDILHNFQQSFTTDFMLVTVSSRYQSKVNNGKLEIDEIVNLLMQHADLDELRSCNSAYSLRNFIMNKDETLKNIAWSDKRWEDQDKTEGIKSLLSKALNEMGVKKKVSKKEEKKVVQINRDLINPDPKAKSCIEKPGPNDVMTGRGGGTNSHPGNIKFRRIVEDKKSTYQASSTKEKTDLTKEVVADWRALDPPGRFLERNSETGLWDDIGDSLARVKCSALFREKKSKKRKATEVEPITLQDGIIDPPHHTVPHNQTILLEGFKWDDDSKQIGRGIVDESSVIYTSSGRVIIVSNVSQCIYSEEMVGSLDGTKKRLKWSV